MYDFCPSISVPPIFYGNNHISFFGNFKLSLGIFQNKYKSWFLVNLYHSLEHYEAGKGEEPSWSKTEILLPQKCKILFLAHVFGHFATLLAIS